MSRAMRDSGIPWIGVMPENWKTEKFKHVFRIKKILAGKLGYDVLSVTQKGLKVKNIENNEGQIANDYSNYQLVFPNDFVMNHMDLLTGYVDVSKQEGVTSPDYRTFYAIDTDNTYNQYYLHIFQFCYKTRLFYNLGQGVSQLGRWRLPAEQQNEFILPVPPISEQHRISDFLNKKCGEIDEAIALQEEFIEELKSYKQSVITEAVTRGLNPNVKFKDSGIDWIGQIPQGWEVRAIKTLAILKSGSNITTNEIADDGEGYPVYGGNGLRGYYSEYSNDGDFALIGRQGALCGNVNYGYGRFWATDHCVVCYPREEYVLKWFGETLRAMNLNQYSLSSAQPGLSVERIKDKFMPVPPLSEQQQIADYLDNKCTEIDSLIAIKQQKIEELKDYKKSVIYEYVTGKKEINV